MLTLSAVVRRACRNWQAVIAASLFGFAGSAAEASAILTTVDNSNAGFFTSLQLDGGNPVVSYLQQGRNTLMLATCTANCQSASPTWVVVAAGDGGLYSSLQLNGGNPVISHHDWGNRDLKLATCTAGCRSSRPTWVHTTVDAGGDVGSHSSLQLNGGNPVVSYYDRDNGDLKLATCTADCQSASPTWIITTVDAGGNVGEYTSLQLNGGNPVVSYYDSDNRDLKLATCTAGCQSASPTWVITTVDAGGLVGQYTSLQLSGGNPVVSYYDVSNGDLKLATCTANCQSASPTWVITTVDAGGTVGRYASLALNGGNPVVSYYDWSNEDLKLAACTAGCQSASPTWVINTVDATGDAGEYSSLQLNGGNPVVSYLYYSETHLKLATFTFPQVSTIARAGANPTNAANVTFTVTFDESVTGVDAGDFVLTATGVSGASIASVSGSGTTWTVTANTGTGSGTLRLDLIDNDSIVGFRPLGGALPNNGNFMAGEIYTVDKTGPAIVGGSRPVDGSYAAGQSLDVAVTYDDAVVVNTAGGTPSIALTVGAVTRNAVYVGGSGTATLQFRYTLVAGDVDADGIDIATPISLNGAVLTDATGNNAATAPLAVAGHFANLRAGTIPTVASVVRAGTSPTNAASVAFTVTFSESVTGVDAADFALTTTGGMAGASVGTVSGAGTTWVVAVNTVAGTGTIRLDVIDNDSIAGAYFALGGSGAANGNYTAGEVYAIDTVAPAIAGGTRQADGNYFGGQTISISVTFSEAVTVDTAGGTPAVGLTIGGIARAANYVSGSGTPTLRFSYLLSPDDADSDGIDIASAITLNGGTIADAIGNDAALTPLTTTGHFPGLLVSAPVTYSGPSATGTGTITASFGPTGPACTYAVSKFIPVNGHPRSPPPPLPFGVIFPHGLFDFTTTGCTAGAAITFAITYPAALPPGTQYWKYGPTPGNAAPHWYVLPAVIAGNTATFTITDGGLGDDDLAANGTIVDQGGPGVGVGAGALQVPTLSEWAMILLATLMLGSAVATAKRAPRHQ